MVEIDLEKLENERIRRENYETNLTNMVKQNNAGMYLELARKAFLSQPEQFMRDQPQLTTKLLQLDADELKIQREGILSKSGYSKSDLNDLSYSELVRLLYEDFMAYIPETQRQDFVDLSCALIGKTFGEFESMKKQLATLSEMCGVR